MFIFTTCQVGAESALKSEFAQFFPSMRSAFARPGFVTFKTETPISVEFVYRSVFARSAALTLGKIEAEQHDRLATEVWKIAAEQHLFVNRVHVFRRDPLPVGEQNFEPHHPAELIGLHRNIIEQSPKAKFLGDGAEYLSTAALPGETVLDVVQVDPNLFFIGTHTITETSPIHVRYSGGILPITLPADVVSRAYLKFNEGFLWSGITPGKGEHCLDIGASPGGCSQFLLQHGVRVTGVDPGAIHPDVLAHPLFTHIRNRIKDAKRSLLRDVQWITADMNVAPNCTLDVLEELVAQTPTIRGLLFTLKLIRWELADKLPILLDRTRSWGFADVRVKQLVFNRQEVMAAVS